MASTPKQDAPPSILQAKTARVEIAIGELRAASSELVKAREIIREIEAKHTAALNALKVACAELDTAIATLATTEY